MIKVDIVNEVSKIADIRAPRQHDRWEFLGHFLVSVRDAGRST